MARYHDTLHHDDGAWRFHRRDGREPDDVQPDMSWVGVLEHHASRTPDKPIAVFGDDVVTYRGMVDRAAALAGRARRRGASAPATSSGCSRTTASSS